MLNILKISNNLGENSDQLIADLGFKNKKILLVSDEIIFKNCQRFFERKFLDNLEQILLLKNPKADEKNLAKILKIAKNFDLIIALGSGVISDLCKLTSAKSDVPYLIFASAASMNGYLSKNASITISGHKKTVLATLPIAVFADLRILKSAPKKMLKAGIGDALCFYSCWFDWYLSHLILGSNFDDRPFKMLKNKMDFLIKNYQKFSLEDDEFMALIIEILMLSGSGMTLACGSYPASQSEHLIAHALEMKYPKKMHDILHGQQIAVTTLTSARVQKQILQMDNLQLKESDFDIKKVANFFGKKVALACKKEFEQKSFSGERLNQINDSLKKNWKNYRQKLAKIYFDEIELRKILRHFKISTTAKSLGLSAAEYQAAVLNAKFIRNRFTCLDL